MAPVDGYVPIDLLQILLDKTLAMIPMLRCGNFWIADQLPAWEIKLPFQDFVMTMAHQTKLIDALDREFDGHFMRMAGKDLRYAEEEGIPVIGRKSKGSLGIGWMEEDRVLVYDSAFQSPEEKPYSEQMPRVEAGQAVPLHLTETCIDSLPEEAVQGLELVKRIDP